MKFVNSCTDGDVKQIFHKSRLCKLRVSPTETAMTDVLREVNNWSFSYFQSRYAHFSWIIFQLKVELQLTGRKTSAQVAIMKRLDHPNIVKLYEIINDPQSDNMYLGMWLHQFVKNGVWFELSPILSLVFTMFVVDSSDLLLIPYS